MGVSQYDKVLPWDPFNYFQVEAGLGRDALARQDKQEEEIDKNSAIFNSLNPAPGHEPYAQRIGAKYKGASEEALNYLDKGEIDKANRILKRSKYEFINDPDVKKIMNSRDAYDKKWSAIMNDSKNQGAIYNMPGVLDDKGKFMPNEQLYDNLDYIAPTAYLGRINEYLKEVPVKKQMVKGTGYVRTDKQGNRFFDQPSGYIERRDQNEYNPAIQGLTRTMLNPTDPDYRYFKADFERQFGQGSFNEKNVSDYIGQLSRHHYVNNDMSDTQSQFIRESEAALKKEQQPPALPQLQLNQNAQNIPTEEGTHALNFWGDEKLSVPYLGSSSMRVVEPIGVDGRYNLGSRKAYIVGDDSEDSAGEYGQPIKNQKTLYNARVVDNVVGYKILEVPKGSAAEGKVGNLVTVGPDYGSIGESDLNRAPEQDPSTGQYYIMNGKNERITVQPVALRVLRGAESTEADAKESENLFFEEMPRKESMKYFGGKNYSNEKIVEITEKGLKKIPRERAAKLMSHFVNDPDVESIENLMVDYDSLIVRSGTSDYRFTDKDYQIVEAMNDLLEEGEYNLEVVPGIITPKTEYTPKGVLGTENN